MEYIEIKNMKLKLLLMFLLTCSFSFGQDYKSIISEAESFYTDKHYENSISKYKEAFKINNNNAEDLYNAGCSAALGGEIDLAFEWLNMALENGWTNINHIKTDSDLNALHENNKWNPLLTKMQQEFEKKEAKFDKNLRAQLLTIFDDDQQIRHQYISAQKEFGFESKQVDSLAKIMIVNDSLNLIKITEILDEHGWVGPDKVGGQANQTLFLVIQHSDLTTQQKYLPMMREAVKINDASASSLALLEDRVALGEGKRQIYGSQIGRDVETNKYYVLPLEDPDNVDKRRTEVGLGPLAKYVKNWDIFWDVEEYKKQLPEIEAKQAKRK